MDSAVTVTDLVVDRGRRRVLHGLTFTVAAGQVTGLLGPSGSGKTTLMRALVGVQQVRSGEVTVLGQPAGSPGLRAPRRLRHPGAERLRRPVRARERPLLRRPLRR